MFRTIVFTSCLVGLFTGLVMTGLQLVMTVPIILEAETYEGSGHTHAGQTGVGQTGVGEEVSTKSGGLLDRLYQNFYDFQHAGSEWEPAAGWQRSGSTLVANIVVAIAFSLLLVAVFSLRPGVQWTEGVLWGLAGYAAFFVLPAIGLPPEIPGNFAADLVSRQGWWLLTVTCSGVGLAMIVLHKQWAWKIAGAVLVVVPHVIGAPPPEVHGGTAPAALADTFIWRTAIVNAVFWLLLGGMGAWTLNKLTRRTDPSETSGPSPATR